MNKRSDCRRLRNRKLGMETLERRELLAAGVGCGTGAVVGPKCVGPAVVQQGDQIRDRDRLRDGSCQTTATVLATQDQIRQRDRLRDGSCQTTATVPATQTQTQQRDRLRDGSCQTT